MSILKVVSTRSRFSFVELEMISASSSYCGKNGIQRFLPRQMKRIYFNTLFTDKDGLGNGKAMIYLSSHEYSFAVLVEIVMGSPNVAHQCTS